MHAFFQDGEDVTFALALQWPHIKQVDWEHKPCKGIIIIIIFFISCISACIFVTAHMLASHLNQPCFEIRYMYMYYLYSGTVIPYHL